MLSKNSCVPQEKTYDTTVCAARNTTTNLPPEIKFEILAYLSATDLRSATMVSKLWRLIGSDDSLWKSAIAHDKVLKNKLQHALVNAVKANDYDKVQRYINLGANADHRITGKIDKNFGFWSVKSYGHFVDPTLLCVAANYAHNYQSIKIVSLLLANKADVSAMSEYHDTYLIMEDDSSGSLLMNTRYHGVRRIDHIEHKGQQNAVAASHHDDVITLLHLSKFENAIIKDKGTPYILRQLEKACDTNQALTKSYLTELIKPQDSFSGVQQRLSAKQIATVKDLPEFKHYHHQPPDSFFLRHWKLCLASAYLTSLLSIPLGSKLGASMIGLLTNLVVPTALAYCIGTITIGLMITSVLYLAKKIYDCCTDNYREARFPIETGSARTQSVSSYSGSLFSTVGRSAERSEESLLNVCHPERSEGSLSLFRA